jgi:hypothetical protein
MKLPLGEPEAIYRYRDEAGGLLFEVVRFPGKEFRCRRPDPVAPSGWTWRLRGVRRVLYRLPELIEAVARGGTVYIGEGERDVEALVAAGAAATCNPGGAGKWRREYASFLKAADVVIVADNDEAGMAHAEKVRAALSGVARRVRIVLPAVGKDASDHLNAGKDLEEFVPHQPAVRDRTELSELTVDDILRAQPDLSRRDLLAANPSLKAVLRSGGSAATVLVDLARDAGIALFHTPEQRAFASVPVSAHEETRAVRSRAFALYLRQLYYREREEAPNQESVSAAVATAGGRGALRRLVRPRPYPCRGPRGKDLRGPLRRRMARRRGKCSRLAAHSDPARALPAHALDGAVAHACDWRGSRRSSLLCECA